MSLNAGSRLMIQPGGLVITKTSVGVTNPSRSYLIPGQASSPGCSQLPRPWQRSGLPASAPSQTDVFLWSSAWGSVHLGRAWGGQRGEMFSSAGQWTACSGDWLTLVTAAFYRLQNPCPRVTWPPPQASRRQPHSRGPQQPATPSTSLWCCPRCDLWHT